jgi:membrane protein DedA with SNARE-associated domain
VPHPAVFAAVSLHHHVHGPRGDYVGLAAAALVSWAAIPGPGEAALVTAALLAAHHHLDIFSVVAVAWLGALAGGTIGWVAGRRAGRAVLSAPGPLARMRLNALARGDRFYERYGPVAVFFTPSWVAGIHDMRASRFLPANAVSALIWALLIGVGTYLAGPSIVDIVSDAGLVGGIAVGVALVATVLGVRSRRSGRTSRNAGR